MCYDDHCYCATCDKHSIKCYCFTYHGPDEEEAPSVCTEHDPYDDPPIVST
jgi:hypothetical protein